MGLLVVLGRLVGSVTGGGVDWWDGAGPGVDCAGPGVFGDVLPTLVGAGCCAGVPLFCAWATAAGAGVGVSEPLCDTGVVVPCSSAEGEFAGFSRVACASDAG